MSGSQLQFPHELISWYVVPAIRRELAHCLVNEKNLSRKETARALSLTEAAVSQYLNEKRGTEFKFDKSAKQKISALAETMIHGTDSRKLMQATLELGEYAKKNLLLCKLHVRQDASFKGCTICAEEIK